MNKPHHRAFHDSKKSYCTAEDIASVEVIISVVHVMVNTKVIHKVTLSLNLLSPPNPSFSGITK